MGCAAKVNLTDSDRLDAVNSVDRVRKRDALREAMQAVGAKQEAIAASRGLDAGYFCRQLDKMIEVLDGLPDPVEEKFFEFCLALAGKVVVERNAIAAALGEIQIAQARATTLLHGRLDLLASVMPGAPIKARL